MAETRHTDLTYLKSLSPGNDSFVKEMIQMFLNQIPEHLKNLQISHDKQQWSEVRATAHAMKSMIAFMGIASLADTVKTVEDNAASQNNLAVLPQLIGRLKEICELSYKELQAELQGR